MSVEAPASSSLQAPGQASALGQQALQLGGFAFALIVLVGLMGPSAVAVTLPQRTAWLPPFWLDLHPSPWLVVGLVILALASGAIGLHLALRALAAGWQPRVRKLVGLGVGGISAVALVPPMGSGDILMYAAYGRVAALGESPYITAPATSRAAAMTRSPARSNSHGRTRRRCTGRSPPGCRKRPPSSPEIPPTPR